MNKVDYYSIGIGLRIRSCTYIGLTAQKQRFSCCASQRRLANYRADCAAVRCRTMRGGRWEAGPKAREQPLSRQRRSRAAFIAEYIGASAYGLQSRRTRSGITRIDSLTLIYNQLRIQVWTIR